jgi:hypothetical protein
MSLIECHHITTASPPPHPRYCQFLQLSMHSTTTPYEHIAVCLSKVYFSSIFISLTVSARFRTLFFTGLNWPGSWTGWSYLRRYVFAWVPPHYHSFPTTAPHVLSVFLQLSAHALHYNTIWTHCFLLIKGIFQLNLQVNSNIWGYSFTYCGSNFVFSQG